MEEKMKPVVVTANLNGERERPWPRFGESLPTHAKDFDYEVVVPEEFRMERRGAILSKDVSVERSGGKTYVVLGGSEFTDELYAAGMINWRAIGVLKRRFGKWSGNDFCAGAELSLGSGKKLLVTKEERSYPDWSSTGLYHFGTTGLVSFRAVDLGSEQKTARSQVYVAQIVNGMPREKLAKVHELLFCKEPVHSHHVMYARFPHLERDIVVADLNLKYYRTFEGQLRHMKGDYRETCESLTHLGTPGVLRDASLMGTGGLRPLCEPEYSPPPKKFALQVSSGEVLDALVQRQLERR